MITEKDLLDAFDNAFAHISSNTAPEKKIISYASLVGFYEALIIQLAKNEDDRQFVIDSVKKYSETRITNS